MLKGAGPKALLVGFFVFLVGLVSAAPAGASGWSQIEPYPGISGPSAVRVKTIGLDDDRRLVYWVADVGGLDALQARWYFPDGTFGPVMNLNTPGEYGRDLKTVVSKEKAVTLAWIAPGTPNEVVKSVTIPAGGVPGPVITRSPVGSLGQPINDLSIAQSQDGTLAFSWLRLIGLSWQGEARFNSPSGPVRTAVRRYVDIPETLTGAALTALSDGRFMYMWSSYNMTTGFFNVGSVLILANGAVDKDAGGVGYVYPTEVQRKDSEGNPVVDLNNQPVMDPSGAEGPSKDVEVAIDGSGGGVVTWLYKPGASTNWRVESARFQAGAQPAIDSLSSVSRAGADIANLRLEGIRGRLYATWFSKKDGGFSTEVTKFKNSDDKEKQKVTWTLSRSSTFVDPAMDVAEDHTILLGWSEPGQTPGLHRVSFLEISSQGAAWPVDVPGADTLKSSFGAIPLAGKKNASTGVFYGVDQNDSGSYWSTTHSDPGIAMTPSTLSFGTGLLNVANGIRRTIITNPGQTSSRVTDISLTGADASEFSLVDPTACLREIDPGGSCPVEIRFVPGRVGPRKARLEVKSDGGDVASELSGNTIARTRLSLKSVPRSGKGKNQVRAGGAVRIKAVVRNTGGIPAEPVKLCIGPDSRGFSSKGRCIRNRVLPTGSAWVTTFKARTVKGLSKGTRLSIRLKLFSGNANAKRVHRYFRIK